MRQWQRVAMAAALVTAGPAAAVTGADFDRQTAVLGAQLRAEAASEFSAAPQWGRGERPGAAGRRAETAGSTDSGSAWFNEYVARVRSRQHSLSESERRGE